MATNGDRLQGLEKECESFRHGVLDWLTCLTVDPFQWQFAGKTRLRRKICGVTFTNPKQSSNGLMIYGAHQGDLVSFLHIVSLVDAKFIDPQSTLPVLATKLTQGRRQVVNYGYCTLIDKDVVIVVRWAPNV